MKEQLFRKNVLVIEDNTDAANSLVQLLEICGHEARAVYSAGHALEFIKQFPVNIAFLDISLPDMNGYDLAREIRRFNQDIILVALSGYAPDFARAQIAGFNHQITKPIMLDTLEQILNQ